MVRDGNIVTAGGVTSGIDFALTLTAEIGGEAVAQAIQLGIEYDPAPPFNTGHPDRAPAAILESITPNYQKGRDAYRAALTG